MLFCKSLIILSFLRCKWKFTFHVKVKNCTHCTVFLIKIIDNIKQYISNIIANNKLLMIKRFCITNITNITCITCITIITCITCITFIT